MLNGVAFVIDDSVDDLGSEVLSFQPAAPSSPHCQIETSHPTTSRSFTDVKYDLFLSHLQRNGQDAIISMQMFLQQALPAVKIFIDLEVDMRGDLTGTLHEGVKNCGAFIFFITDGILRSEWCAQELRWAVQYDKPIVLVRETDERHGGLEMAAFFQQVPVDLLHVFKNNIAIPWYRQPGFREVSLQSIIKAAGVEDTYTKDLRRLGQTTKSLMAAFKGSDEPTTCVDVIEDASFGFSVVFFFGGFTRFRTPWLDRLYAIAFNLSFWICGMLCTTNLIYQTVPYHIFSIDMLTAYVHLPAWQSWYRWRKFVHSRGCDELLTKTCASAESKMLVNKVCRAAGWLVLLLQVAMVADVLLAFSLPGSMNLGGKVGEEVGRDIDGAEEFTDLHAWAMYAIIPPVIAAMFASYTMFAFVAMLHLLDIRNVKLTLEESIDVLSSFYKSGMAPYKPPPKDADGTAESLARIPGQPGAWPRSDPPDLQSRDAISSPKSTAQGQPGVIPPDQSVSHYQDISRAASEGRPVSEISLAQHLVDDIQAQMRKVAMEEHLFKTVCNLLIELFKSCQARMDHTCKKMGWLWIHLVFFSTLQVIAVSKALSSRSLHHLNHLEYKWWWGLQDFFHLGGGIVLLSAAMVVFCAVTSYFKAVRIDAMEVLIKAGCPPPRQAAVMGLLLARPLGMHVFWKTTYIDAPKAVAFFMVIGCHVLSNTMDVLAGTDK